MSDEIKRIDRSLIHKGTIIEYYVDTMSFPNGNQAKWDFIKHNGAAAVVPVTEDGKILMVSQYRNALERDTIEVPAGARDSVTEDTRDCAIRELEEETGYKSNKVTKLLELRTTVAFCNEMVDVYLAEDLVPGEQHLDDAEDIRLEKYTLDELLEKIYAGVIQDAKTVAAILAYSNKIKK